MCNSYIKLNRELLNWEWLDDSNTLKVWIVILLSANWEDKKWHGTIIKRGSFVTSINNLSERCNMSPMAVRTCLKKLKSTNEITIKATNKNTQIIVNKWEDYQLNDKHDNKQITNKQQTNNKQITTTKEYKEYKEYKNIYICPTLEEVSRYCKERNNNINPEYFVDYYQTRNWELSKGRKVKDWKACIRTWESRNKTKNELPSYNENDVIKIDEEELNKLLNERGKKC